MNLAEYIKDPEWAAAREIFNAKFESIVDAIDLMRKINEEKAKFNAIIYQFNKTIYNTKVCLSLIALEEENLRKRKSFKESHIAKLIQTFIENNTNENLDAIKKEIELSNEFDIHIIPEWKPGNGERMYGVPQNAHFAIGYTNTFYPFDHWDIDEDIANTETEIENAKDDLNECLSVKDELYDKYGITPFAILLERFEKEKGPLEADPKWAYWSMLNYDDDDDDDDDY